MTNYRIQHFSYEDVDDALFAALEIFCQEAEHDHKLPNSNWQLKDWENRSETFFHCLFKTKRFLRSNGEVTAVFDENRIVALSGIYLSDFARNEVAIGGVRAHTLIQERNKFSRLGQGFLHGDLIFPQQLAWARARNLSTFALTFNAHNRWLAEFILRIGQKKAVGLGFKPSDVAREFYSNFKLWPNKLIIKETPQYVLYKQLTSSLTYDFSLLESAGNNHASIS